MSELVTVQIVEFMARDRKGAEFTTQQLATWCLFDPYRAGELRDYVMPTLAMAGHVEILPADADHNMARYVLTDIGCKVAFRNVRHV